MKAQCKNAMFIAFALASLFASGMAAKPHAVRYVVGQINKDAAAKKAAKKAKAVEDSNTAADTLSPRSSDEVDARAAEALAAAEAEEAAAKAERQQRLQADLQIVPDKLKNLLSTGWNKVAQGANTVASNVVEGATKIVEGADKAKWSEAKWSEALKTQVSGTGVGHYVDTVELCKKKCVADVECQAIQYSETDTQNGNNCFIYDNQVDTGKQYKTPQIYKYTREGELKVAVAEGANKVAAGASKVGDFFSEGARTLAEGAKGATKVATKVATDGATKVAEGANKIGGDIVNSEIVNHISNSKPVQDTVRLAAEARERAAEAGAQVSKDWTSQWKEVGKNVSEDFQAVGLKLKNAFKSDDPGAQESEGALPEDPAGPNWLA